MTTRRGQIVTGGGFYERDPLGRMTPTTRSGPADVWICRRLADYPEERMPATAATTLCCQCLARIVFNPARTVDAPKMCMQCAGIEPLPFGEV